MADPITELRLALIDHMRADPTLPLSYDEPPQSEPTVYLPYITLGPTTYDIELVDCVDGGEVMQQIDIWSNAPGQDEIIRLAGAVRTSLKDFEPSLSDNAAVEFSHWRTDFLVDGAIKHAAMRFTAIVEESTGSS